ncbi:unnamed protein product [Phaedon cochleariae]|uniref:Uncharacterized protein n=1 Tax=Phaedon cochleariae TaxID=80249 RepID=A0A9N9SDE0_PHACE|nr:unnamed protein product [Phaedon cochleariae]
MSDREEREDYEKSIREQIETGEVSPIREEEIRERKEYERNFLTSLILSEDDLEASRAQERERAVREIVSKRKRSEDSPKQSKKAKDEGGTAALRAAVLRLVRRSRALVELARDSSGMDAEMKSAIFDISEVSDTITKELGEYEQRTEKEEREREREKGVSEKDLVSFEKLKGRLDQDWPEEFYRATKVEVGSLAKACDRGDTAILVGSQGMEEKYLKVKSPDSVLQRCKTFNTVSLVEFISLSLEDFYKEKLLRYASSRDNELLIYVTEFCKKSVDLRVVKVSEDQFTVTSAADETFSYQVNAKLEVCDCPEEVYNTGVQMHNDCNNFLDKIELATLTLENTISIVPISSKMDKEKDNEITVDFGEPMIWETEDGLNETTPDEENNFSVEVNETKTDGSVELKEFKDNLKKISMLRGISSYALLPIVTKFNRQMKKMDSEASFYALCSSFTSQKKSHRINVQPTSIARRTSAYRADNTESLADKVKVYEHVMIVIESLKE